MISFRYYSVCHPYNYRDLTQTKSVPRRVILYVVPVVIFSVLINIPKFFETRIVNSSDRTQIDFSLFKNGSLGPNFVNWVKNVQNKTFQKNEISYEMTSLRNNPDYIR